MRPVAAGLVAWLAGGLEVEVGARGPVVAGVDARPQDGEGQTAHQASDALYIPEPESTYMFGQDAEEKRWRDAKTPQEKFEAVTLSVSLTFEKRKAMYLELRDQVQVDAFDKFGETAVTRLIYRNRDRDVKVLLDPPPAGLGADPNQRNQWGTSPLAKATYWGAFLCITELCKRGADANKQAIYGWEERPTPLHWGAAIGDETSVLYLMKQCRVWANSGLDGKLAHWDKTCEEDVTKECPLTPMQVAAHSGHAPVVRTLLDNHGLQDVHHKSLRDGKSPLMLAALGNHLDVVELLVQNGAEMEQTDARGQTALLLAAKRGALEATRLLVKLGAKVEARASDGRTSLTMAAAYCRDRVAVALLEGLRLCEHTDSFVPGEEGSCSYDTREEQRTGRSHFPNSDLVKANSTQTGARGNSALHLAVQWGCTHTAQALVFASEREILNLRNADGLSAMDVAILSHNLLMVRMMIKSGAQFRDSYKLVRSRHKMDEWLTGKLDKMGGLQLATKRLFRPTLELFDFVGTAPYQALIQWQNPVSSLQCWVISLGVLVQTTLHWLAQSRRMQHFQIKPAARKARLAVLAVAWAYFLYAISMFCYAMLYLNWEQMVFSFEAQMKRGNYWWLCLFWTTWVWPLLTLRFCYTGQRCATLLVLVLLLWDAAGITTKASVFQFGHPLDMNVCAFLAVDVLIFYNADRRKSSVAGTTLFIVVLYALTVLVWRTITDKFVGQDSEHMPHHWKLIKRSLLVVLLVGSFLEPVVSVGAHTLLAFLLIPAMVLLIPLAVPLKHCVLLARSFQDRRFDLCFLQLFWKLPVDLFVLVPGLVEATLTDWGELLELATQQRLELLLVVLDLIPWPCSINSKCVDLATCHRAALRRVAGVDMPPLGETELATNQLWNAADPSRGSLFFGLDQLIAACEAPAGIGLDTPGPSGDTFLQQFAKEDRLQHVKYLVRAKADLDAFNTDYKSALHMLAEKKQKRKGGVLSYFTADKNAGTGSRRRSVADPDAIRRVQTKDRGGGWVRENPEATLIRLLLEHGANRSVYDGEGQTAYMRAEPESEALRALRPLPRWDRVELEGTLDGVKELRGPFGDDLALVDMLFAPHEGDEEELARRRRWVFDELLRPCLERSVERADESDRLFLKKLLVATMGSPASETDPRAEYRSDFTSLLGSLMRQFEQAARPLEAQTRASDGGQELVAVPPVRFGVPKDELGPSIGAPGGASDPPPRTLGGFSSAHLQHAFGAPPALHLKHVPTALQALVEAGALQDMSEVSDLLQFGKHRFLLKNRPDLACDLTGSGFWLLCCVLWMLALHDTAKPRFEQTMRDMPASAQLTVPDRKKAERIIEKAYEYAAERGLEGDEVIFAPLFVVDVLRCTFVVAGPREDLELGAALCSHPSLVMVRTKNGHNPQAPSVGGYADRKFNLRGEFRCGHQLVVEVQVLHKSYLTHKKKMHALYATHRGDYDHPSWRQAPP